MKPRSPHSIPSLQAKYPIQCNMDKSKCTLCPRKCAVDRKIQVGFCGQSDKIRIARAALHMWEEPCISGKSGSGTVFFCGCTLGCVYCQNYEISAGNKRLAGKTVSTAELAQIFLHLQNEGANNINLVTPTMFSDKLPEVIILARQMGLVIPVLYNSSGYENVETLKMLEGYIDIYLPDFKYASPDEAKKYSSAENYSEIAINAISEMKRQTGSAKFNPDGIMTRGLIVRHLLLPTKRKESEKAIKMLFDRFGNEIYYSIMSQYTPVKSLDTNKYPELSRRVTAFEYQKLVDYAISLGITNGFIQDGKSAKESFIPEFNNSGCL